MCAHASKQKVTGLKSAANSSSLLRLYGQLESPKQKKQILAQ